MHDLLVAKSGFEPGLVSLPEVCASHTHTHTHIHTHTYTQNCSERQTEETGRAPPWAGPELGLKHQARGKKLNGYNL